MNFKKKFPGSTGYMEILGQLQFQVQTRIYFDFSGMPEDPAPAQVEDWCLVDRDGNKYKLPKTMLFMGSDECDIVVRSQTVDKRHAVITFDHYLNKFKIKDLTTANGTFVNEARIQDQEYVTLEHMDSVRLGYDSMVYHMEEVREDDVNFNTELDPQASTNMPSWATKELPQAMAECQGCIAEQRIEHTCVGEEDQSDFRQSNHEHMIYDDNHQHGYHDYAHDNGNKQQNNKDFGCNTWPRKRMRNVKNIATFFTDELTNGTSVDDHSCNRILRGESSHPQNLPSELETVKKATPLYGQPDWWGEEDAEQNDNLQAHNSSGNVKGLHHSNSAHFMDHVNTSQRTGSLDRDVKFSPDKKMPSVESSLSKDSLLSHDPGGTGTPEKSLDFQNENKTDSFVKESKPSESTGNASSMAFTVDFDEDTPKMNMSGKLSEFMPSKIRKSFRERKEKAMTRTSSKDGSPEKEEPFPKIEPADISPDRQKKEEDLWELPDDSKKKKSSETRKSSRSHDSDTDCKTPEMRKTPKTSHGGDVDKKTPEVKKLSRSLDAEVENKAVTAISAKGTSTKTHKRKVTSGEPKKSMTTRQKEEGSVTNTSTSVTESASYLIDRMFESGNTKTGKGSTLFTRKSPRNIAERFTEHAMYREAKQYDKSKTKESDLKNSKTKEELKSSLPEKDIDEVKDNCDNVSETGTYTIEADKDDSQEKQARQDIDRIFGVTSTEDVLSQENVEDDKNMIKLWKNSAGGEKPEKSVAREVTLEDFDTEMENLEQKQTKGPADSMEVEVGSNALQELRIVEENENVSKVLPDDAPTWVTQWAALTSHKGHNNSADMDAHSPSSLHSLSSEKDELRSSSKKPSHGLRRRGTGRKLPRVPAGDKSSPSGSEYSSKVSESTGSPSGLTPRQGESSENKVKAVTISSQVVSRYEDTDTETVSKTKFTDSDNGSTLSTNRLLGSESERTTNGSSRSTRSVGSIDTELLLKDTETVMAAMEARMESGEVEDDLRLNGHNESFSDTDSMVAMVNGDESYLKPTHYESPRVNLQKSTPSKQQQKPVLSRTKSAGARLNAFRENLKRQQSLDKTVVSDVLSETPTESSYCGSENSDYGANSFTRTSSKGKGKMSMTRPNRAFQLRRARADGDEPTTPSTAATASSLTNVSKASTSVGKSSSTPKTPQTKHRHSLGTDRTEKSYESSARSDASLGAQIVARSRINNARSTGDLVRRDGGRHSLRMSNRSLSSQESSSSHTDVRKSDFKAIKARLKNPPSYGLTVTGVSKSASQSTNNSRTNSPKSAEKAAWKRRKEYDPRKAVAEAKIKARDSRSSNYTTEKNTNTSRKMTRSASFTNSSELRRFRKDVKSDSLSSADDISSCTNSEVNDTFDERSLSSRSFIPYTGRSHSSRLYHSSEDEELGLLVKSSQDLSRCLLGSVPYMSAFTPPPPKIASSSPVSPIPLSVFKPRLSNEISNKFNSINGHLSLSRNLSDLPISLQSYDNILVSSIYQLSLKLKTATDKSMQKLKDHQKIENGTSPSPIEELLEQSTSGDMPAWKSANQELAGILNNLRKIEHHVHVMNTVLFPGEDLGLDSSASTRKEKQEYLQEIERIRGELAGFQPITTPEEVWKMRDGEESVESDCEELGVPEEFF